MAEPKVHIKWTAGIMVVYLTSGIYTFTSFKKMFLEIVAIIFFGVLMDFDHISSFKLSKIKDGSWVKKEGEVDWLHTQDGLMLSLVVSLKLWSWWPFISFFTHTILIDSRNSELETKPEKASLPALLHKFWPKKWTYCYDFKKS